MTMVTQTVQGVVKSVDGQRLVLNPLNTTYELHLALIGAAPAVGSTVRGTVRMKGRKVWTVASGGNFIVPITGEPRVIQGRMKQASPQQAIVYASAPITVELPQDPQCYDLVNGPVGEGAMVNITIYPGASFEIAG